MSNIFFFLLCVDTSSGYITFFYAGNFEMFTFYLPDAGIDSVRNAV